MLPDNSPNESDAMPSDSTPTPEAKPNTISLSPDKLSELGLDSLKPGDIFVAPARWEVEADDQGTITGVCIQAMGHPADSTDGSDEFVDIDDSKDSPPETEENMDGEATDGGDNNLDESTSEDDAKREKIFGFKPSKASKNLPKPKDIFGS